MYKKLKDLEIPLDKPFEHDKLKRDQVADNLTKVITSTEDSFVLSVNAPWGMGKTTFIKMWKQKLINEGHPSLYFNAWENDYCENPFYSFLSEIHEIIDDSDLDPEAKGEVKRIAEKLISLSGRLFRKFIPLLLSLVTSGVLNLKDEDLENKISQILGNLADERINEYQEEKKTIGEFKKTLQEFAVSFVEKNESYKLPLVIFVDELDRCRPNYAIDLLENIKHLFSVEGIIFILGVDKGQLVESVKSQYGQGMDANGYLRRFIDIDFNLPDPPHERFCRYLLVNYFDVNELLMQRDSGNLIFDELYYLLVKFAEHFNLSLRSIGQLCGYLSIVIRFIGQEDIYGPIIFLLLLKINSPDLYEKFKHNDVSTEEIVGFLKNQIKDPDFFDSNHWIHVEAFLVCSELSSDQIQEKITYYQSLGKEKDPSGSAINPINFEFKMAESLRTFQRGRQRKSDLIDKVEFAGRFEVAS